MCTPSACTPKNVRSREGKFLYVCFEQTSRATLLHLSLYVTLPLTVNIVFLRREQIK